MEFLPVEKSACYRCRRPRIGEIEPFRLVLVRSAGDLRLAADQRKGAEGFAIGPVPPAIVPVQKGPVCVSRSRIGSGVRWSRANDHPGRRPTG